MGAAGDSPRKRLLPTFSPALVILAGLSRLAILSLFPIFGKGGSGWRTPAPEMLLKEEARAELSSKGQVGVGAGWGVAFILWLPEQALSIWALLTFLQSVPEPKD